MRTYNNVTGVQFRQRAKRSPRHVGSQPMRFLAVFLFVDSSPSESEHLVPVLEGALDRRLPDVAVAMRSVLAATSPGVVHRPEETLVEEPALLVVVCGTLSTPHVASLELVVAFRLDHAIPLESPINLPRGRGYKNTSPKKTSL